MRSALFCAPSGEASRPKPDGQPVSISSDLPSGVTNSVPPPPSTSIETTFRVPSAASAGTVSADVISAAARILRIMLFPPIGLVIAVALIDHGDLAVLFDAQAQGVGHVLALVGAGIGDHVGVHICVGR